MNEIEKFHQERAERITAQAANAPLKRAAADFMAEATTPKYSYNFEWMGRPIIQYPMDIVAMQEIIWRVKPDLIVETGVAHGGSVVFYASMLELLGRGTVLGIDVDIRSHNHGAIVGHSMARRIQLIEGSSVDQRIVEKVKAIAGQFRTVLVVLDSNHTHEHVAAELEAYAGLVSVGSYMVVFDTIIEHLPPGMFPDRPWSKGNNPASAVSAFLAKDTRFEPDAQIDAKLLVSVAPGGYLKRVR
jgi:cephalosporin hydroxylase